MLIIFVVFFEFTTVFPTHIGSFYKNDPALSFPSVRENLSGPVLLLLCIITPMLCMILPRLPSPPSDPFFYWLPTFGNLLTLIITNALKCITGELRPSFLALCKVNESISLEDNFVNRSMSAIICTGEEALDGRHSFPSSHCSQVYILHDCEFQSSNINISFIMSKTNNFIRLSGISFAKFLLKIYL